jgi:site-specific recombinase XerD
MKRGQSTERSRSFTESTLSLPPRPVFLESDRSDDPSYSQFPHLDSFIRVCGFQTDATFKNFDEQMLAHGLSEKSRKDYLTDIYQFLLIKLLSRYDLPRTFDRCAAFLVALHTADSLDKAAKDGSITEDAAKKTIKQLIDRWGSPHKLKPLQTVTLKGIPGSSDVAITVSDNNLHMSLRSTGPSHVQMAPAIALKERAILDCFMAACSSSLNMQFWKAIFNVPSVEGVLAQLKQDGSSNSTIARKMASLTRFEKFLVSRGLLETSCVRDIHRPRAERKAQPFMSAEQIKELRRYFKRHVRSSLASGSEKDHLFALRDQAVWAIGHYTAIRATALCSLRLQDFDPKKKTLFVRDKGNKHFVKPLDGWALECLTSYLEHHDRVIKLFKVPKQDGKHLFFSKHGRQLKREALDDIIHKAVKNAGISVNLGERTHFGPHAVRRSRMVELREKGASVEEISNFADHKFLNTTQIYLQSYAPDQREMLKRYDDE